MCWWCHLACFSTFFHLLGGLSWKVSGLQHLYLYTNIHLERKRVILSTIQYLGGCSCPNCFIKKEHIGALGTKVDEQRQSHLRADTQQRQMKVDHARMWIFDKGRSTNSQYVNNLLQEDSWTPTRVCFMFSDLSNCLTILEMLECLFWKTFSIGIQVFLNACTGSSSQVRAWRLEGYFHSSDAHSLCSW